MARSLIEVEWEEHLSWFGDKLRIVDKASDLVPLRLNPIQLALERRKWDLMRAGKPVRFIVLKARQEGVSTWAEATFFKDARMMDHRRSMVIAHDEKATRNLFQMTRRYHKHLPDPVKTHSLSSTSLAFEDNESEFTIQTAGTGEKAGRSFTCHAVHFSELDFYTEPWAVFSGAMQTIPNSYPSVIIIESTANGPNLAMQTLWDRAVEGRSVFEPFFFPWFVDETYRRKVTYDDLLRYGPKAWVDTNRRSIEASRRKYQIEEEEDGLGRSGGAWTTSGSGLSRTGGREADVAPDETSAGEDRGTRGEHEAGAGGEPPRGQAQEPEADAGREIPGVPGGGTGEVGGSGPATPPVPRELRAAVGSRHDDGWREVARVAGGSSPERSGTGEVRERLFSLDDLFLQSLTPYELGLKAEFDLSDDQINWLRYCLEDNCQGSETTRRREYPSRPEEAFEASGADILDPHVIAKWTKESKTTPSLGLYRFDVEEQRIGPPTVRAVDDAQGKIEIFTWPDPHRSYVMSIDPSQGVADSDWIVGFVMDVQSGDQVAEFRATIDPDIAISQLEALGIFYNNAFTGIETNGGYGWPFVRHLEDRATLPMYEREVYDRKTKQYAQRPGWDTNVKMRPILIAEMKESVRKERCKIRSLMTLMECSTLWENEVGKIEARPGKHDDGPMAYGIALILRNHQLGMETEVKKKEREENSFIRNLNQRLRLRESRQGQRIPQARTPVPVRIVRGTPVGVDGRRSYL